MNIKSIYPCCILASLIVSSCAPKRDLVYFSNMASSVTENNTQAQETRIHKNDVVNITMTSSNPESNLLFISNKNAASGTSLYKDGYRVNKSGYVNLPLIGDFKIEGLGVDEAQTKIAAELDKYVKNPVVDIQIVNFKITVIGEVNKPSTFIITDEKVNLLEALGMAGDMTVYGRRENVLVIRNEGNHKTMKRLNLNKQEAMNSPYFYLTQNDIVYVEPDRSKAVEYSQNTRLMPLVIASISAVAVLAAVLLKR